MEPNVVVVVIFVAIVLFVLFSKKRLGTNRDRMLGIISLLIGGMAFLGGLLHFKALVLDPANIFSFAMTVFGFYYIFKPKGAIKVPPSAPTPALAPTTLGSCPTCSATIAIESLECPKCKTNFSAGSVFKIKAHQSPDPREA